MASEEKKLKYGKNSLAAILGAGGIASTKKFIFDEKFLQENLGEYWAEVVDKLIIVVSLLFVIACLYFFIKYLYQIKWFRWLLSLLPKLLFFLYKSFKKGLPHTAYITLITLILLYFLIPKSCNNTQPPIDNVESHITDTMRKKPKDSMPEETEPAKEIIADSSTTQPKKQINTKSAEKEKKTVKQAEKKTEPTSTLPEKPEELVAGYHGYIFLGYAEKNKWKDVYAFRSYYKAGDTLNVSHIPNISMENFTIFPKKNRDIIGSLSIKKRYKLNFEIKNHSILFVETTKECWLEVEIIN